MRKIGNQKTDRKINKVFECLVVMVEDFQRSCRGFELVALSKFLLHKAKLILVKFQAGPSVFIKERKFVFDFDSKRIYCSFIIASMQY